MNAPYVCSISLSLPVPPPVRLFMLLFATRGGAPQSTISHLDDFRDEQQGLLKESTDTGAPQSTISHFGIALHRPLARQTIVAFTAV